MHEPGRPGAFTLVELIVVVAIIGILAAIALPQLAARQGSAFDATVASDVRLAATAQEAYFADDLTYSSDCASLPGFKASPGVVFAQCDGDTNVFLLETDHPSSNQTCTFDSGSQPSMTCARK